MFWFIRYNRHCDPMPISRVAIIVGPSDRSIVEQMFHSFEPHAINVRVLGSESKLSFVMGIEDVPNPFSNN